MQVKQAVRVNGLTEIALTKLDILSGLGEVKVCTGYKYKSEIIKEMPSSLIIYIEIYSQFIELYLGGQKSTLNLGRTAIANYQRICKITLALLKMKLNVLLKSSLLVHKDMKL